MKVLLDGHGVKLLAVRGKRMTPGVHEPQSEEPMDEVIIETDKGNFIISGCHACPSVFFKKERSG